MPDQVVQLNPDGTGKKVDTSELTVGANTVERQRVVMADPTGAAALASVQQFHNADNQNPGATAYGLLTGGVAQLLNAAGNIDRQREAAGDSIASVGIATGSASLASVFTVTSSTAISAPFTSPKTVTPSAMSGASRGAPWSIQPGSVLLVDVGTAQERVVVTAVTATTFTALFANAHSGTYNIVGRVYNESRDATIADGSTPAGVPANATFLLNTSGGIELERAVSGELSGATGVGMNVATEYEWNSGGPTLASGTASGLAFDRANNLQGKGRGSAAITSTAAGATSITFGSAAATNLIQPGSPIGLSGGATRETVYSTVAWVPGSAAVVPLQFPVVNAGQTVAEWDQYAPTGPGLAGFTAAGIGIEEEALWDPASNLFYIERAATQDAVSPQNVVLETPGLINPAGTADRGRSLSAAGDGLGVELTSQPSSAPFAASAAANTATVVTLASVAGQSHRVTMTTVSWSGTAPTTGTLTLSDGVTTLSYDVPLTLNTPFSPPFPPGGVKFAVGAAVTVTVAAGGAGAVSKLNVAKLTA